jgi:dCMP deaminase
MDWNTYFLNMLPAIAAKSPDPRCKVGCVVVNADNSIVTTGHNGLPRKAQHLSERLENPLKAKWFSHAETNALLNHARQGGSGLKGCTLFCSFHPCSRCAVNIVQAGIARVVVDKAAHDQRMTAAWAEDMALAGEILAECGVQVDWVEAA